MTLPAGTRLGHYEIVHLLGAGGMGEVYRARDPRLGRDVAVKVLPGSMAQDPERQKRFELEARAASSLNHPGIITLHDIGVADGAPYLVTEMLEGETWRTLLARGPLPPARATALVSQVAFALAAAHAKDIVHRDLKPENLFVLTDGRVKILDFGIAKLLRSEGSELAQATAAAGLTQEGMILGTVSYMAPEQLRGPPVDRRADLFALGVILQESISGRPVFAGDTVLDRVSAILSGEPEALPLEAEAALPGLGRFVRRALEKSPEDRFDSARDFAYALEILTQTARERAAFDGAHAAASPTAGLDIHQITFREGYVDSARFAPDGMTVVYRAAWEGGPTEIIIARTDSPDYHPLQLGAAALIGLSAQAELLIGLGSRDLGIMFERLHTLARVSMLGGTPRELARDVTAADWGAGGTVAAVREVAGRFRLEYPLNHVLHETTGWLNQLRVSPDGRWIAFFEHPLGTNNSGHLHVIDPSGTARRLVSDLETASSLAWHPKGGEIWFVAERRGEGSAVFAASLDGELRVVYKTLGWPEIHDFAADGRALLSLSHQRLRLQTGTKSGGGHDRRELSWLDWSHVRDITPDGFHVLFAETGTGMRHGPGVFLRSTDGSPAVRIADGIAMGFMPDGDRVLARDPRHTHRLMIHPLGAGEPTVIDLGDLQCQLARPLPDGQSLVAVANRRDGPIGLYRIGMSGGDWTLITREPIAPAAPLPSPDGEFISIRQPDGTSGLCPVNGGPLVPLPVIGADERICGWTSDGKGVYVYQRGTVPASIDRIEISTQRRERWLEMEPMTRSGVAGFTTVYVTPDGERYAATFPQFVNQLFAVDGLR